LFPLFQKAEVVDRKCQKEKVNSKKNRNILIAY